MLLYVTLDGLSPHVPIVLVSMVQSRDGFLVESDINLLFLSTQ